MPDAPRRGEPASLLASLENGWDERIAAQLRPEELLLYRSNLLGSDRRITNFGGGNTSAKLPMTDPLTQESVMVLWVPVYLGGYVEGVL